MASSLSPECTPLKREYDSCFNSWFEGYLEPLSNASGSPSTGVERERRSREQAEEYERKCGSLWRSYKECVQVSDLLCV